MLQGDRDIHSSNPDHSSCSFVQQYYYIPPTCVKNKTRRRGRNFTLLFAAQLFTSSIICCVFFVREDLEVFFHRPSSQRRQVSILPYPCHLLLRSFCEYITVTTSTLFTGYTYIRPSPATNPKPGGNGFELRQHGSMIDDLRARSMLRSKSIVEKFKRRKKRDFRSDSIYLYNMLYPSSLYPAVPPRIDMDVTFTCAASCCSDFCDHHPICLPPLHGADRSSTDTTDSYQGRPRCAAAQYGIILVGQWRLNFQLDFFFFIKS